MAALIAYYSRAGENYFGGAYRRIAVGNTGKAANMLAELTGGELYKIEQEQPYSEGYMHGKVEMPFFRLFECFFQSGIHNPAYAWQQRHLNWLFELRY